MQRGVKASEQRLDWHANLIYASHETVHTQTNQSCLCDQSPNTPHKQASIGCLATKNWCSFNRALLKYMGMNGRCCKIWPWQKCILLARDMPAKLWDRGVASLWCLVTIHSVSVGDKGPTHEKRDWQLPFCDLRLSPSLSSFVVSHDRPFTVIGHTGRSKGKGRCNLYNLTSSRDGIPHKKLPRTSEALCKRSFYWKRTPISLKKKVIPVVGAPLLMFWHPPVHDTILSSIEAMSSFMPSPSMFGWSSTSLPISSMPKTIREKEVSNQNRTDENFGINTYMYHKEFVEN